MTIRRHYNNTSDRALVVTLDSDSIRIFAPVTPKYIKKTEKKNLNRKAVPQSEKTKTQTFSL